MFNVGSWNAKNNPDGGSWWNNFRGIYLVNHFLANSDNLDLEMYRLNPDDIGHEQYQNRLDNIKRWKYEARFLRAYFYFELIKRYGGVRLIIVIVLRQRPAVLRKQHLLRSFSG